MNKIIKAPGSLIVPTGNVSIFLAGTIDMGNSDDWQTRVSDLLLAKSNNLTIFNPRRVDWDNSWKQSVDDPQFLQQVKWEHNALTVARHILFYFAPGSQSPISLLELGLFAGKNVVYHDSVFVCCPEGYWRKGNVDFICSLYGIKMLGRPEDITDHL